VGADPPPTEKWDGNYSLRPAVDQLSPAEPFAVDGCVITPALFIPVGWWHRVEAREPSISMSFTNFVFPNEYIWQHPEKVG
jgi:hypothetical protein